MATLTGNKPKDTYKGLIKTSDSNELTSEKQLSDGNGNNIPLHVSTDSVRFSGEVKDSSSSAGSEGQSLLVNSSGTVQWTDVKYSHNQSVGSDRWTVQHNLGFKPSVTVLDTSNNEVYAEIQHSSNNQLDVRFKNAQTGKAYLV